MPAKFTSHSELPRALILASVFLVPLAGLPATAAEPTPALETVATVDIAPGNIAVAPDGTVILSTHPSMPTEPRMLAISNGSSRGLAVPGPGKPDLEIGQGIRADRDGVVWMVSSRNGQHLYAWNLAADRLVHDFTIGAPAVNDRSSFNDVIPALNHGVVFVSDSSGDDNSAIIAVDIATGRARRLLEGHSSMHADPITAVIDGKPVGNTGPNGEFRPFRGALNPITIDAAEEWVYYGALAGQSIYRVSVADLLDESLSPAALAASVEYYAAKVPSAGITMDDAGNIYVTDIQAKGIGVAAPGRDYRLLVSDPVRLDWPDGISVGPDGYVYVVNTQLHHNFASHRDTTGPSRPPYYVTRLKALAGTTVGR